MDNWILFAIFEGAAALFLAFAAISFAFAAITRQRRSQALRDEQLQALQGRIAVIEMCERRRVMNPILDTPSNLIDTTGLLTRTGDVRGPPAPQAESTELAATPR